jgi:hypothetical protein
LEEFRFRYDFEMVEVFEGFREGLYFGGDYLFRRGYWRTIESNSLTPKPISISPKLQNQTISNPKYSSSPPKSQQKSIKITTSIQILNRWDRV